MVDPDAEQPKQLPQRPIKISAWKLAKLDSNEAAKVAAKARASSSIICPINSGCHSCSSVHLSGSNVSGRSYLISIDQGFPSRNARAETSRLSPSKSTYPPSLASRDDMESCVHSVVTSAALKIPILPALH
ncbi:hypothetical protein SLE2022_122810 [Rubroshorea leprosula]